MESETAIDRPAMDWLLWSQAPLALAWIVAIVATAGSLNFSGIGPIGFYGMGYTPCELCWYQRIMMYPLTLVLGFALFGRSRLTAWLGATMAAIGGVISTYHSILEKDPSIEGQNQCLAGVSCKVSPWHYALPGGYEITIPNLALIAFVLILVGILLTPWWMRRVEGAAA